MIEQEEKRVETIAPQTTQHTRQQEQLRSRPAVTKGSDTNEAPCAKSSCGSKMYALSFILPAAAVAAIYLPEAMQSGNCALATIPSVLAGSTALGLYRLCKFIRHRK